MERVKRIMIDIILDDDVDGNELAESVAEIIESEYQCSRAEYLRDVTAEYLKQEWL